MWSLLTSCREYTQHYLHQISPRGFILYGFSLFVWSPNQPQGGMASHNLPMGLGLGGSWPAAAWSRPAGKTPAPAVPVPASLWPRQPEYGQGLRCPLCKRRWTRVGRVVALAGGRKGFIRVMLGCACVAPLRVEVHMNHVEKRWDWWKGHFGNNTGAKSHLSKLFFSFTHPIEQQKTDFYLKQSIKMLNVDIWGYGIELVQY